MWNSTLQKFLDAVAPKKAVISTSDPVKNLMNILFPNETKPRGALPKLVNANIPTYITSVSGTIVAETDGLQIIIDKKPIVVN